MENIVVNSQFGHEIMVLGFAKGLGLSVVILPKKETEEEWKAESEKILDNLSFFSGNLRVIDFADRKKYEAEALDIVGKLKSGALPKELWTVFAASHLKPEQCGNLPEYPGLKDKTNILVVPQKLISDGECGVTAAQQSLPLEVFNFLKGSSANLVLGQHFHKSNDLEVVGNLAKEFDMYIPGMTENNHVFGIRGVQHKEYYNMYASLAGAVGIAGTHTWIMLTMFPEIPQIILYNEKGVENWKDIEKAFQKQGYQIYCMGFSEETDMREFSSLVAEKYNQIFG